MSLLSPKHITHSANCVFSEMGLICSKPKWFDRYSNTKGSQSLIIQFTFGIKTTHTHTKAFYTMNIYTQMIINFYVT